MPQTPNSEAVLSFWDKLTGKKKSPDQYILEGNYKSALKLIMDQLRKKPDEPSLLLKLANLYVKMGDKDNALKVYIRVGDYYGKKGFFNKSVAAFKKALNLDPENKELLDKLADFNEKVPKYMVNSRFLNQVKKAVANEDQTHVISAESEDDELDESLKAKALPKEEPIDDIQIDTPEFELDLDEADQELLFSDLMDEEEQPPADIESETPLETDEEPPEPVAPIKFDQDFWDEEIEFDLDATLNAMDSSAEEDEEEELEGGIVFKKRDAPQQKKALEESGEFMFHSFDDALDSLFETSKKEESHIEENKKHWPIFRTLSGDVLMELILALETRNYAQGQVIFKQNQAGKEMFLITEGKVQVLKKQDGKVLNCATLLSGDFFGEGSVLTDQRRTASVLAIEDTEVLILEQDQFNHLVQSHPEIRDTVESIWLSRNR